MKKISLFLSFLICSIGVGYSQGNTNYGVDSGTLGQGNNFFGKSAGKLASATETHGNVGVGSGALFKATVSKHSVAVGNNALADGGEECTAVGVLALGNRGQGGGDGTGKSNTAVGYQTLRFNENAKNYNTAVGAEALRYTNGEHNTALGYLAHNSFDENDVPPFAASGSYNTALGSNSLQSNEHGSYNIASGYRALYSNIDGNYNVASGAYSLHSNIDGQMNTAAGYYSLYANTTGHLNTSNGGYSLNANVTGSFNTATGYSALQKNNLGTNNTADGYLALSNNTTASYNTASGTMALNKVATGSYNTGVGYRAGQATDVYLENTTAIGYLAVPTASNQVRIGNTSVTSIGGYANWTNLSDGRFKKDIREDVSGLDFIRELRPVSYTVDNVGLNKFLHVTDSSSNSSQAKSVLVRQTGFIAQEVEALVKKSGYVFSGVDAPENESDPYGIRYAEFVVPLVKGMQELAAKVEAQQQHIELLLAQLDLKSEGANAGNTRAVLVQNSPNPFDSETAIQMTLSENIGLATVMIFNLEGKQMKSIQVANRGEVTVKVSASELAAGMYLYSLIVDGKVVDTKKMVLTR